MFKKLAAGSISALMAMSAFSVAFGASGPQEVSGSVLFPMPHPQDPTICFQGTERRINMATQGYGPTGTFGYVFDVDKTTWKGKFKLVSTGSEADLDIYFFQSFGDPVEDPSMNSPVILTQYQERNTEGEAGVIPPNTTKAIVCMFDGFHGEFDYTAAPPAKKKKK